MEDAAGAEGRVAAAEPWDDVEPDATDAPEAPGAPDGVVRVPAPRALPDPRALSHLLFDWVNDESGIVSWPDADRPRRGQKVGPFTVLALLGKGELGWVYLARSASGRPVAVKTLGAMRGASPHVRDAVARDLATARRIPGLYTAEIVASDLEAPVPWLATAYVAAPSLADLVPACGPLPPHAVRWLAAGAAEALAAVHAAGLRHRDLKPGNLLVGSDGPRIVDTGIAHALDRSGGIATLRNHAYLAPEQARGAGTSTASDVFSLGLVLFYAATGRAAYVGMTESETLARVRHGEPDLTGLPEALAELIEPCLAADPDERPSAASLVETFAEELEARQGAYGAGGWLPAEHLAYCEQHGRRGLAGAQWSTMQLAAVRDPVRDQVRGPVPRNGVVVPRVRVGAVSAGAAGMLASPDAVTTATPVVASRGRGAVPGAVPVEAVRPRRGRQLTVAVTAFVLLVAAVLGGAWLQRDRGLADYVADHLTQRHTSGGAPGIARASGAYANGGAPAGPSSAPSTPPDPLVAFADALMPGSCVDFASDGTDAWQPSAPVVVDCTSDQALQRVLGRTEGAATQATCMAVDGRGTWVPPTGGGAVCLERLFHIGDCVPADMRDGGYWAFLYDLVPCSGPIPGGHQARLRIVDVVQATRAADAVCPVRQAVFYELTSRSSGLCAVPVT